MNRRPAYTLIFIGLRRSDRVDLGPRPDFPLLGQFHRGGQEGDDPVIRVEAALAMAPRVGKSVWVLWEGATTQMLDMPAGVVAGLEQQDLADALSFEAESLTGVSGGDSSLDGVFQRNAPGVLPDYRRYWITQVSTTIRDQLAAEVAKAGAKLAGIAHPGGLPRAKWGAESSAGDGGEWRRVEVWDQVTISLFGQADGTFETRVIRSSYGSEGWVAELPTHGPLAWMGSGSGSGIGRGPHRLTLVGADGIPLEPENVDLPAASVPIEWLRAWAAELTASSRRVPAVELKSRVSPLRKYYLVGGIAGWVVLTACIVHGWLLVSRPAAAAAAKADQLEAFRAQLAQPPDTRKEEAALAAETEKLRPQLSDLEIREKDLTGERDRLAKLESDIASKQSKVNQLRRIHRPALAELLAALADAEKNENPSEVVIKEVRQLGDGDLRLTGLCAPSSAGDAFANRLEQRLARAGWSVGPAQKRLREDVASFDFSVVLAPKVLSGWSPTLAAGRPTNAVPATQAARSAGEGAQMSLGGRTP